LISVTWGARWRHEVALEETRYDETLSNLDDHFCRDTVLVDVSGVTPLMYATTFAVECEGDVIELTPVKHAYDPAAKQIRLAAANFQAHATSVKSMNMRYDRHAQAIVNWRQNKGRG
jgi:hypothetical protein